MTSKEPVVLVWARSVRGRVKQCPGEKWVASTGLADACVCEEGQDQGEDDSKRNVENNFSEI